MLRTYNILLLSAATVKFIKLGYRRLIYTQYLTL
jgi:hypothetical protein